MVTTRRSTKIGESKERIIAKNKKDKPCHTHCVEARVFPSELKAAAIVDLGGGPRPQYLEDKWCSDSASTLHVHERYHQLQLVISNRQGTRNIKEQKVPWNKTLSSVFHRFDVGGISIPSTFTPPFPWHKLWSWWHFPLDQQIKYAPPPKQQNSQNQGFRGI